MRHDTFQMSIYLLLRNGSFRQVLSTYNLSLVTVSLPTSLILRLVFELTVDLRIPLEILSFPYETGRVRHSSP